MIVTTAALAFLESLTDGQRTQAQRDHTLADARRWSNYPQFVLGDHGRVGLATGSLTPDQWTALDALLGAALGSAAGQGLDRLRQHLAADDYIYDRSGDSGYGAGAFYICLLGPPSDDGVWELQFGGHHLAIANTYADGRLAGATPAFRGVEPYFAFPADGRSLDPERRMVRSFADLLAALDERQAKAAELHGNHPDLVLGPGEDGWFPNVGDGLTGARLDDRQRVLLRSAIATFVDDLDEVSAAVIQDRYDAELDETRVAWSGNRSLDRLGDYVRIDGPSVWMELSMRVGINFPEPHPHAVWRDRQTDYGGAYASVSRRNVRSRA